MRTAIWWTYQTNKIKTEHSTLPQPFKNGKNLAQNSTTASLSPPVMARLMIYDPYLVLMQFMATSMSQEQSSFLITLALLALTTLITSSTPAGGQLRELNNQDSTMPFRPQSQSATTPSGVASTKPSDNSTMTSTTMQKPIPKAFKASLAI